LPGKGDNREPMRSAKPRNEVPIFGINMNSPFSFILVSRLLEKELREVIPEVKKKKNTAHIIQVDIRNLLSQMTYFKVSFF